MTVGSLRRNRAASRALAVGVLALLLFTGCLEETLVWSPDGSRGAVLGPEGLYLCKPDGELSALQVPGAYHVAWLADSQQLVIARSPGGLTGDNPLFQAKATKVHGLVTARLVGGQVVTGSTLHEGLGQIREIRPSPGGRAVAFVAEQAPGPAAANEDSLQLLLTPVDRPDSSRVATGVAAYPDWSPDGRSLIYVQASGSSHAGGLQLGTLVQRCVLDTSGRVSSMGDARELAAGVFSADTRVRCLADGRIVFNATEVNLPVAAGDTGEQRDQLFAVDPARQATLVRLIPRRQEESLPPTLAFFEISPDQQRILFGDPSGAVCLFTLATGEVEAVQAGAEKQILSGQPVWRRDGAFSYTRRAVGKGGQPPARKAEVVLRTGNSETVLSAAWPDQLVNDLVNDQD